MGQSHRLKSFHDPPKDDQREGFERDRDRILYCSAFRRLAGVAQVVRAGEADVFHTRLTHSLKVAQIGRRLAQLQIREQPKLCGQLGVDPEVVEAACLAHDLGHPPFGHLGEKTLNKLVLGDKDQDGYNGNAQAFRIVTKLAVRFGNHDGLNLTRATLAAILKYPWMRGGMNKPRSSWSAYSTEQAEFDFARDGTIGEAKTAEAELMDWADDIAYSVHDLEDFHRCRLIPWHIVFKEGDKLISNAISAWKDAPADADSRLRAALNGLLELLPLVPRVVKEPYEGTRDQRQQVRFVTSVLIGRYVPAIKLKRPGSDGECVEIEQDKHDEVRILKQITRDYIIANPALAAQQRGHKRIIEELFEDLKKDISSRSPKYLPIKFRHLVEGRNVSAARAAADCIASLTEGEAMALHGRLQGYASGSVLDPIVR